MYYNGKMAGAVGIEPTSSLLESAIIPLYDTPVLRIFSIDKAMLELLRQNGAIGGIRTHEGVVTPTD